MRKFILILAIYLQILKPTNPSPIRPKFQNIQDFQYCLITYLNTIGIIQITNSQNDENSAINCENFHIDLKSSIENMYKLIKLNLYEALGDDKEAECMDEVFRYTKFMEYNVIATTAVQLQPNGFQELKNLLHISKNIFIYATMKCLISNAMIGELFQHFATQIQVDDGQFGCVVQHVSENQLMEDFIVKNIDEFLNEKFMEESEEDQAFTFNPPQNVTQIDKNTINNSAEPANDSIDTNINEPTLTTTQVTHFVDIPSIGSEIREVIADLNELASDINEEVDIEDKNEIDELKSLRLIEEIRRELEEDKHEDYNHLSTYQNLLQSFDQLPTPSILSTTPANEQYQAPKNNDLEVSENIFSELSTVVPEIIAAKLRKIDNTHDGAFTSKSSNFGDINNSNVDYSTISSITKTNLPDDEDQKAIQSTLPYIATEPSLINSEKASSTRIALKKENFNQPPNLKLSTTEQFGIKTSVNDDEDFTPTASMLKLEDFPDVSLESYEDFTTTSHEHLNKMSNFSEKFENFVGKNLKNADDSVMAPKKVMILERPRPVISNIQKIAKSKHSKHVKIEVTTQNVRDAEDEHRDDSAREDESLSEFVSMEPFDQDSDYSIESSENDYANTSGSINVEELTKVAQDFMESNENGQNAQMTTGYHESQETSTLSINIMKKVINSVEMEAVKSQKLLISSHEETELIESRLEESATNSVNEPSAESKTTTDKSVENASNMIEHLEEAIQLPHENTNNELRSTTISDVDSTLKGNQVSKESLKNNKINPKSGQITISADENQVKNNQNDHQDSTTDESTSLTESSSFYVNQDNMLSLDEDPFITTEDSPKVDETTKPTTIKLPSTNHQKSHEKIDSNIKKNKIVFKIKMLPDNLSEFTAKLLNDTKSFAKNESSNVDIPSLGIEDDQNPNHFLTTTMINSSKDNLRSRKFQNLAKSFDDRQKIKNSELKIPDSRIKRQTSSKSQSCPSIIENLGLKIKNFNLESMDEELNSCVSQLVNQHDIDDYFVLIVLKKYGSTELQANEKNKKLMNMIMSFIGKYIECTDLYGFMEMAGFPQSGDGYY